MNDLIKARLILAVGLELVLKPNDKDKQWCSSYLNFLYSQKYEQINPLEQLKTKVQVLFTVVRTNGGEYAMEKLSLPKGIFNRLFETEQGFFKKNKGAKSCVNFINEILATPEKTLS